MTESLETYKQKTDQWFTGLILHLKDVVMPLVIPNTNPNRIEIIKALLSPKTYPYWMAAFTHPSYNPNPLENYDVGEKLGDRVMNLNFVDMIIKEDPSLPQDIIALTTTKYMSKAEQRKKSDDLKLVNYVRIVQGWNPGISEDLLESLFGALFIIGDIVLGKGEGYALCNNLMISLYKDTQFDFSYKDPISKMKEIYEKMHWSSGEKFRIEELETFEQINGENVDSSKRLKLTLRLTPKAQDYIRDVLKKEIKSGDIIASGSGSSKKQLTIDVYEQALKNLEDWYGINTEWAIRQAGSEDSELYLDPVVRQRMQIEGFIKIYFGKPFKNVEDKYIQLIGVSPDDHKSILVTVTARDPVLYQDMKKFAIDLYKKHGSVDWSKPVKYVSS